MNPAHLFIGTARDNSVDMLRKGRHGEKKLTMEKVQRIRDRWAIGGVTQQAIADDFGVTQVMISRIVRGVSWAF